jgi:hypothetical protein
LGKLYGYDNETIKPLSEITTMVYKPSANYNIDGNGKISIEGGGDWIMDVSTLTRDNVF